MSAGQVENAFDTVRVRQGPPALAVLTFAGTASMPGPGTAAAPGQWWQAVRTDLQGTIRSRAACRMPAVGGARS